MAIEKRERNVAKFWLKPVRLHGSGGFPRAELRDIERVVEQHAELLMERWDEFFAD